MEGKHSGPFIELIWGANENVLIDPLSTEHINREERNKNYCNKSYCESLSDVLELKGLGLLGSSPPAMPRVFVKSAEIPILKPFRESS